MKDKSKRIAEEEKKLKKIFVGKTEVVGRLISRAAFLLIMAEDMETELKNCNEFLNTTINASQQFVKSNPLLKDYRETIKSYQAIINQLIKLTDTENPKDIKDELEEFLSK